MVSFYSHLSSIYLLVGSLIAGRALYEFRVAERCKITWQDWLLTLSLIVLWLPALVVIHTWVWLGRNRD